MVQPGALQDLREVSSENATPNGPAGMIQESGWLLAVFLALWAGVLDWRYRRIPNWLTVPGLLAGIAVNTATSGWPGAKASLLGAGLGLLLLLPFVVIKALGAGDWKLIGAMGACLGTTRLIAVLIGSVLVAGVMALGLIIYKGRARQALVNIGHMLRAFLTMHLPGPEVSLDNPDAVKIPFGVAVALTVILFGVRRALGVV
jgi:prepilin peptidase CpaA